MRRILVIFALASCMATPGTETEYPKPSCRDRCDSYRIEHEGGWSGLVQHAGEDRSKYKRCMELCRRG